MVLTGRTANPMNNPAAQAAQNVTTNANQIRLAEARKRAAQGYQRQGVDINPNVIGQYDKTIADTRAANPQAAQFVDAAKNDPTARASQFVGDIPGMAKDRTALYDPALSSADLREATGGVDYSNIFKGTGYQTGQKELGGIISDRDALVRQYLDEAESQRNLRSDTFTRLFGPESRLAEFYSPSLKAVQAQISGLTGDLTNLEENISSRFGGQVLTEAQKAKIGQQERGQLTRQLDDMTRAQQSITDALNLDRTLSEAEFNAVIDDATAYLGALETQYRELGMPEEQIQFLTNAVSNQFNREATLMAEQMGIAEELRAVGRAGLEVDRNLSSDLGYMVNSQGQYMLDENFNPIPYSPAGGSELEFKTVGKAAYIFDPATGEYELVEGTGNAGGGGDGTGGGPGINVSVPGAERYTNMNFYSLIEEAQRRGIITEDQAKEYRADAGTKGTAFNTTTAYSFMVNKLAEDDSLIGGIDQAYAVGKAYMETLQSSGVKPTASQILVRMKTVDANATIEDAQAVLRGQDPATVEAKAEAKIESQSSKAFQKQAESNVKAKIDQVIKRNIGTKPINDPLGQWQQSYNALLNKYLKSPSYSADIQREIDRLKSL